MRLILNTSRDSLIGGANTEMQQLIAAVDNAGTRNALDALRSLTVQAVFATPKTPLDIEKDRDRMQRFYRSFSIAAEASGVVSLQNTILSWITSGNLDQMDTHVAEALGKAMRFHQRIIDYTDTIVTCSSQNYLAMDAERFISEYWNTSGPLRLRFLALLKKLNQSVWMQTLRESDTKAAAVVQYANELIGKQEQMMHNMTLIGDSRTMGNTRDL